MRGSQHDRTTFGAGKSRATTGGVSSRDFVGLLRPAFVEDEWMLVLLGAGLGFVAGWLQLLVVIAA